MNASEYQKLAMRTKSSSFHADKVDPRHVVRLLEQLVQISNSLSAVKAALYYGRALPEGFSLEDLGENVTGETYTSVNADLLHAALGVADEAGEVAAAILPSLSGKNIDMVNILEELGDIRWFTALGATSAAADLAQIDARNIEKLRKRFPNKFTEDNANNRNLDAERSVLEG